MSSPMESKSRYASPAIWFLIIPIGAIILVLIINFIYDQIIQVDFDNETKEVLTELMYRTDLETREDYKNAAIELYKKIETKNPFDGDKKKYSEEDLDNISVIVGSDFVLLSNYYSFTDAGVVLNLFNIKWINKDGYIDDNEINKKTNKKNKMITSKYIARFNEYSEPTIEKYTGDDNELFLEEYKATSTTTTTTTSTSIAS